MSKSTSSSSLTKISFEIFATRWANRHVLTDSSNASSSPLAVATMTVTQFPPKLSRSIVVIKLFRYGTCVFSRPSDRACNATMTCSRKCSDTLMYFASCNVAPSTPLLFTRSLPAKSTKFSFARRTVSVPRERFVIVTVNIQCDRDEAMLRGVSATARLVSPTKSKSSASSSLATTWDVKSNTCICPCSSSNTRTRGNGISLDRSYPRAALCRASSVVASKSYPRSR